MCESGSGLGCMSPHRRMSVSLYHVYYCMTLCLKILGCKFIVCQVLLMLFMMSIDMLGVGGFLIVVY